MACRQWMQADAIRFRVTGRGVQGLLARAAGQGIRLRGVLCAGAGYAATVSGRDWPRLQALAAAGEAACREIYVSWEEAAQKAYLRYEQIVAARRNKKLWKG